MKPIKLVSTVYPSLSFYPSTLQDSQLCTGLTHAWYSRSRSFSNKIYLASRHSPCHSGPRLFPLLSCHEKALFGQHFLANNYVRSALELQAWEWATLQVTSPWRAEICWTRRERNHSETRRESRTQVDVV